MDEDNSFDLAISLDHIKLVDTFFHINRPGTADLQSKIAVTLPQIQKGVDIEARRIRVHAIASIQFFLFGGEAPAELTSENASDAVVSFGAAMDVAASSPYVGPVIPVGKHSARSGLDVDDERDRQIYDNITLEILKSAYSFASARLLEVSGLSPFGAISMPLMDPDEMMDEIQKKL